MQLETNDTIEAIVARVEKLGNAAREIASSLDAHIRANTKRHGEQINIMDPEEHAGLVYLTHACRDFDRGVRAAMGRPMFEHEKKN
jgi:hypothetical protein